MNRIVLVFLSISVYMKGLLAMKSLPTAEARPVAVLETISCIPERILRGSVLGGGFMPAESNLTLTCCINLPGIGAGSDMYL